VELERYIGENWEKNSSDYIGRCRAKVPPATRLHILTQVSDAVGSEEESRREGIESSSLAPQDSRTNCRRTDDRDNG
jgi:hypothetical protein